MKILQKLRIVDIHTAGEPTRILLNGLPFIKKKSMIEIKKEISLKYDHLRKILVREPRGHSGMFGAIIVPPVDTNCDLGVVFVDTGGYLNMCGHGSIGVAKYAIESNLVEKKFPVTKMKLDTPAGIIELEINFKEDKSIKNIILTNVKSFNYLNSIKVSIDNKDLVLDVAFGGNFFAIIDADIINLKISIKNIDKIKMLGMKILKYLNTNIKVQHSLIKGICSIDLIEFNSKFGLNNSHNKNVVIFGDGQYDRSPCGTGTSAKLANMYFYKKIGINEKFINESITGTKFIGKIIKEDYSDNIKGIIPQIISNAYIIGYTDLILEENDPINESLVYRKLNTFY